MAPCTERDGVERQSPGGDARFELGGPIAAAAERVEERVEGCGVEDRVRRVAAQGLVEAEAGTGGAGIVAAGAALEPSGGGVAVAARFGVGDVVHADEVLEQCARGRSVEGHGTTGGSQTPLQQRRRRPLAAEQPGGAPAAR